MAWTDDLTNDSLKTLTLQASSDNTYTYQEILAILESAAVGGITSSEWVDLKSIYTNASDSFASDYLDKITYNVIYTNTANAKWWGGATSYSSVETLGNMFAGMSEQKTGWLIDKWFMGLDLPMPIAGGDPADAGSSADTYNYSLSDGPLFIDGVEASDITQGATGDCYLLACLGAISAVSTDVIEDIFIDNGNGTYGVRFYLNNEAVYTTVNLELPTKDSGNIAFGSNASRDIDGETWISLLEKAYVQLNMQADINNEDSDWDGENSYYAIEGGLASPLNQITNLDVTYYSSYYTSSGDDFSAGLYKSSNANTYKQTIIDALDAGSAGWLGTWGTTYDDNDKKNFIYGHAFIIMGYDSNTDLFTFRNPWGDGGSSYDGEFQAAIEDFWNSSVKGLVALTEPLTNATPDPTPDPEPAPDFTVASSSISVTEGASTKTGTLDSQTATYSAASGQGNIAGFTLYSNGSYNFDPDNSNYDYLATGEALQLTFNYSATNSQNQIAYGSLTINITGTDDPTSFSGQTTGTVIEDQTTSVSGTLVADDPDSSNDTIISQSNISGSYGSFTINSNGQWNYELDSYNNDVQSLLNEQTIKDIFIVKTNSGDTKNIIITIIGRDDNLVLDNHITTIFENSGTIHDSVANDSLLATYNLAEPQENITGLIFNTDGSYSFDSNNPAYDNLQSGKMQSITLSYTATNNVGDTGESTLFITLIGKNDAPIVDIESSSLNAMIFDTINHSDNFGIVSGNISASDADSNNLNYYIYGKKVIQTSNYGTLNLDQKTGAWSYTPNNIGIESLKEKITDNFTILVSDNKDTTTTEISIELYGIDDKTIFSGDTSGLAVEDSTTITDGNLLIIDPDSHDNNITTQNNTSGTYGLFKIDSNGSWSYELDNSLIEIQTLAEGQTLSEQFLVIASSGASQNITMTINGQNDPLLLSDQSTSITEEDDSISGSVADTSLSASYAPSEEQDELAGLSFNGDGSYIFDPSLGAYDYLKEGEIQELSFSYIATNEFGETGDAALTIAITGKNDAPVFNDDQVELNASFNDTDNDDQFDPSNGNLVATDIDDDDLSYFLTDNLNSQTATYGSLSLDSDSGTWTYTPNDSAIEGLKESTSEVFTVFASDGIDTDEREITISLYGSEDPTIFSGDTTGSVIEDTITEVSGILQVSDLDTGDSSIISQTDTAGICGFFSINSSGQWSYLLDNDASHVQSLVSNQVITDTFTVTTVNGITEEISINLTGSNDEITLNSNAIQVDEGNGLFSGSIADSTLNISYSPADNQEEIQGLTFNNDGSYSFDTDHAAYNSLKAGEPQTLLFAYTAINEQGETGIATLTITVTGDNDSPELTNGQSELNITYTDTSSDDSFSNESGSLQTQDADNDTLSFLIDGKNTKVGSYGSLTIDSTNGDWSFSPDDHAIEALKEDTSESFDILISDGHSDISTTLTFNFTAGNDQTLFTGDTSGSVTEDNTQTVSGQLIITDLDTGDSALISQLDTFGSYGSFSIDSSGSWDYQLENNASTVQSLTDNQTVTDTFTVTSIDGVTQDINITVNGRYDALALTSQQITVREGESNITGRVATADALYSLLDDQTSISGLTFNSDGSYQFNAANSDYDYLTANDNLELTLPYQATNTQGESGNAELKITLLGVNDLPVLVQPLSSLNAVIGTSISYQIADNSFTDPDQDEQLSYTASLADGTPLPGWLQFDPDSQTLSGNTSNQTTGELSIRITATDPQGGNISEDFTLTLIADNHPLANSPADDLIYGSDSDHDTALVSCLPGQYVYDDGQLSGADGNDSLVDVEYIGFGYQYGDAFQVDVLVEDLIDPDGEDGEEKSNAAQLMDKISDLYIAYFGRAPDASGFTYWFKEIYTDSHTFEDAANAFSYSQEYQDNYPEGTSNRDFIETVYINLFNRKPDTGGWDYWEGRLDEGLTRDIFLLSVVNGAYATTSGEDDRSLLGNKHDISVYYAEQSTLYPNEGFDEAINLLLNRVTDDANTALSAITVIDHAFENEVTLSGIFEDQNLLSQLWS